MSKHFLKIGVSVLLILTVVHLVTFYTISEDRLISAVGRNYETYVLDLNEFSGVTFLSETETDAEMVKNHFKLFEKYEVNESNDFENPIAPISENRYEYMIKNEAKNPFKVNVVKEWEHAPEFAASWESKYVWILFDRVLIKKENTGIS